MTAYFDCSNNVRNMVDKTYYTYGSELTCEDINQFVSWINDVETFKTIRHIPPSYDQYVPLVHVLNHGNFSGDTLVRFFTIYDIRASFAYF